jgi:hypothetical protein
MRSISTSLAPLNLASSLHKILFAHSILPRADGPRPARIGPLLLSDLLVSRKQPSLSLVGIVADRPASPPASVSIRGPKAPAHRTTFQCLLPKKIPKIGPDKDPWFLRCFCDIDAELGDMIQCEKCLN